MIGADRGRIAPSPPHPYPGNAETFTGVHAWNAPRAAVEPPPYLIRKDERLRLQLAEQLAHAQETLSRQPGLVQRLIRGKMDWIERSTKTKVEGIRRANNFLVKTFIKRVLPRLSLVHDRMAVSVQVMDTAVLARAFNGLPSSGRKSTETLARAITDFIRSEIGLIIDEDEFALTSADEVPNTVYAQRLLDAYSRAAEITRRFRRAPPGQATFDNADIHDENINDILDKLVSNTFKMCSEKWWLHQLVTHAKRWREGLFIALAEVSKKKGKTAYASHDARCNHREQKRRNREFLEAMELEDEEGDRVSLIDKVYASVANPTIRRHELMVRVRGYEDVANSMAYEGLFLTITAPSKYHSTTRHGYHNHKWCGALPNETQAYFTRMWSRIRAKLGRKGLGYFGVRVTEAHHDGTPHWHMLIFIQPDDRAAILTIFEDYARDEDSKELTSKRARKARFHCEVIDKKKGSATGYIAKYISKNIDGYALDDLLDDETHKPMTESARAIGAWASLWGIKQFQFLGCVPVSPWREFRQLDDHDVAMGLSVECAIVHDAANKPDWAGYVMAQGGPFVKRADLTVRPWYEQREQPNDYGEVVKRIRGVYMPEIGEGCPIITHTKEYKIVLKKRADDAGKVPGLAVDVAVDLVVDLGGTPVPPRSSVINCTGQQKINNSSPEGMDRTPPPFNPDVESMTPQERRAMLQRLRSCTPEKGENPLMQVVQSLSIPLTDEDWPPLKASTSPPGVWAAQVTAEREASARAYHKVALQWEEQRRGKIHQKTPWEVIQARALTQQESQLDDFARSIGLTLTRAQVVSLAAGAVLVVEGLRYRVGKDGVLYIENRPVKEKEKKESALFERLKKQAAVQMARKRKVDSQCNQEQAMPDDPIVWIGPYAR
ncbi:replication endonuclease [Serratia fonticola]|uniref:replication endonuclease n=1 Tax=Serratia fonticola TaxID=47917 RepID=UPI003BB79C94